MSHITRTRLHPGCQSIGTRVIPHTVDCSFRLTANIVRDADDNGVLLALGGRHVGYSLFIKDGHLVYDYNYFGAHTVISSPERIPDGEMAVELLFTRTGPHQGTGQLLVDGESVATADIAKTVPRFMGLEPLDVGRDTQTPVSELYDSPFAFSGELLEAVIEIVE